MNIVTRGVVTPTKEPSKEKVETVTNIPAPSKDLAIDEVNNTISVINEEESEASYEAVNETESFEEVNYDDISEFDPEEINESDEAIKEAFNQYNLSDEDAIVMIDILREYKETKSAKGLYNKLPASMKEIVDGIIGREPVPKKYLGTVRARAVEMILENFLQDAKFNQAFDDLEEGMNDAIREMNEEYNSLFNAAINETFDKIDEIKVENPEQAARIEAVKHAFDDADNLAREKETARKTSKAKLTKWRSRLQGELASFNKRINNTSMKLPKLEDLYTPIRNRFVDDEYSDDDIYNLLTIIERSHLRLIDGSDIAELAYVYKLMSTIYSYTFVDMRENLDAEGQKIFNSIMEVMDILKSL